MQTTSWQVLASLERRLAETPLDVWQNPAQQPGWTCVKRNDARTVWRIEWAGLICYAKYYRAGGWRDRLRQLVRPAPCTAELQAGQFVMDAGIPAARPLACCETLTVDGAPHAILISAGIERALPLGDAWLETPAGSDQVALTEAVARLIAHAHQAGFEHLDMHAGNILVQRGTSGPTAYFVDLQSAHLDRPVDDYAVVRNLAQLNQWFRRHSCIRIRLRFLRAYLRWRNHFEPRCAHGRLLGVSFPELVRALVQQADGHAELLWQKRDRRLRRKGRYYAPLKLGGGWHARVVRGWKHPRSASAISQRAFDLDWWRSALVPEALLEQVARGSLKESHSAAVAQGSLEHPDGPLPVVVKRPRARNWKRRLRHLLHPSRVARNWRCGHMLLHRDLVTAAPLAMLERRWGPFVVESLLITEFIPESEDLGRHLTLARAERSTRAWSRYRQRLAATLARHLRQLHVRGFRHRDCKADNILVIPGRDPQVVWIDLDGVRRIPGSLQPARRASDVQQIAAITRLHVSLAEHASLSRTDRARFLKCYFGGYGNDPRAWRAAWQQISAQAAAGQTRREERQAWKVAAYGRS